jgi:hypothetical protein
MSRGRKRNVRYYPSRSGYFTTYQGRTYCRAKGPDDQPAGPTFTEACRRYGEIVCAEGLDQKGNDHSVIAILDAFLVHGGRNP